MFMFLESNWDNWTSTTEHNLALIFTCSLLGLSFAQIMNIVFLIFCLLSDNCFISRDIHFFIQCIHLI